MFSGFLSLLITSGVVYFSNPNFHQSFCEEPFIAELQIEPNQNHLLKNLEGSIFAWLVGRLVGCSSVTVATVLMLLWPLKMLKLFKL